MAKFEQKGRFYDSKEVESIECKDGKTRFRLIENKKWVRRATFYEGSVTVRVRYVSSRKWNNRTFAVTFDYISNERLSDEKLQHLAENIIESEDDTDWFDFHNQSSVAGAAEEVEVEVETEDDINRLKELDKSKGSVVVEDHKTEDLKGWGASE